MTPEEARAVRSVARLGRALECVLPDMSLAQYRVLAAVDDGGDRATLLARALTLAKPTVTSAVDGLVERGYLCREPVPGDRRAQRIALTPAGHLALVEAEEAMAGRLTTILEHGSSPAQAVSSLAALEATLEASAAARAAASDSVMTPMSP